MTTLQELLKLESDLTHMFDSDQRVAMALLEYIRENRKKMLEKEKEQMCEFTLNYFINNQEAEMIEDYYDKTYNKEK